MAVFMGISGFCAAQPLRSSLRRKSFPPARVRWDGRCRPPVDRAGTSWDRTRSATGFTGTSIWIDPDRQLFVVFLTNRVHPTRENQKIGKIRPSLHDAVLTALGYGTAAPAPANR